MNILPFSKLFSTKSYLTISILGKSFKLNIKYSIVPTIEVIKKHFEVDVVIPKKFKNMDNTKIINMAIGKFYVDVANKELEESLELARHILKFAPNDYKIEELKHDYYKCLIKEKTLLINPEIIKFNRKIIDTTILQAFCKIQFKANSSKYASELEKALKKYEAYSASYTVISVNSKVS